MAPWGEGKTDSQVGCWRNLRIEPAERFGACIDRAGAPSTAGGGVHTDSTLFPSERATGNLLVDLGLPPSGLIYSIYGGGTHWGLSPTRGANPLGTRDQPPGMATRVSHQ